jgi:hypothetical protein
MLALSPYELGLVFSMGIIVGFAFHGLCRTFLVRKPTTKE